MNVHAFRRCRRRDPPQQRGLALIEMTICLPLLLLMLLATAEVGRFLFHYNTLAKAVRDGARYAANNAAVGTTRVVNITAAVETATRNLVVTGNTLGTGTPLLPGLTVANVTVNDVGNGFISVAITNYNYEPALGALLPTFGLGASINLGVPIPATIVMRALNA